MIKEVEFKKEIWYQIKCENCNEVLEDHDGHNLMPDELSIENMAMEQDWKKGQNETHLCLKCAEDDSTYWDE